MSTKGSSCRLLCLLAVHNVPVTLCQVSDPAGSSCTRRMLSAVLTCCAQTALARLHAMQSPHGDCQPRAGRSCWLRTPIACSTLLSTCCVQHALAWLRAMHGATA